MERLAMAPSPDHSLARAYLLRTLPEGDCEALAHLGRRREPAAYYGRFRRGELAGGERRSGLRFEGRG